MPGDGYDCIVIGAGVGGLVSAALLAKSGQSVLVLESHDKPGGTAGYYEKAGFVLDAGATTLIGLEEGGPLASILETLGIEPDRDLGAKITDGVEIESGGDTLTFGRDEHLFESGVDRAFPAARPFFQRSERDASALWDLTRRWPVLPLCRPADLLRNVRALHPSLLRLLPTAGKTVEHVRRQMAAPENGPFRKALDLSLLITVQNTSHEAPWWNGALGLNLFRRGVYRPRGGMKTFAHSLLDSARRQGARVELRTLVTGIRHERNLWHVKTARNETFRGRRLIANLPPQILEKLHAGPPPRPRPAPLEEGWGALVLNLGLSRAVNPHEDRLHFLWLLDPGLPFGDGNSLFLSFSPPGDPAAPPLGQTLSVSSHTRAEHWEGLGRAEYAEKKAELRDRILSALSKRWPGIESLIVHEDLATPKTFRRYVRRPHVGGLRTTLGNSGFLSRDPTLGLPSFHLVGDTTFPGAGTLACAMSAVYAAERLGALRISRTGEIRFRPRLSRG
ncbi:MAG: FAD-dependent oxidoreductase [Acidobacteria bacterium]|nr:FAD-dependent oxidoreductase [Acidobacteriota bacterium]